MKIIGKRKYSDSQSIKFIIIFIILERYRLVDYEFFKNQFTFKLNLLEVLLYLKFYLTFDLIF